MGHGGRRGLGARGAVPLPPAIQLGLWDRDPFDGAERPPARLLGSETAAGLLAVARPDRFGQFPLFEERRVLLGELESAFDDADCDGVAAAVNRIRATYDGEAVPEEIRSWLPRALPPGFWERDEPVERRHAALVAALDGLAAGRARRFRDGFLLRLLERHRAPEIVGQDPELLPAVFALLHHRGRGEEARRLVLDALLAGRELVSLDFAGSGDDEVVELLSENRPSVWLACLGVLRNLWQPPRLSRGDVGQLEHDIDAPLPRADVERGTAFWRCLVALWNRGLLSDTLETRARIRMKRLDPELHGMLFG